MGWFLNTITALIILASSATLFAECPNGQCGLFPQGCSGGRCSTSPALPSFQCPSGRCGISTSSGFTPLLNTPTERTIAVNGVAVPEGAIGYKFINGRVEWVFGDVQGGVLSNPSAGGTAGEVTSPNHGQEVASPISQRPAATPHGASPGAISNGSASGLVPANTRGNPGFQFSVRGPGFNEMCQATLISANEGKCYAATAAHCLEEGAARSGIQFDSKGLDDPACHQDIRKRGIKWGTAKIGMANFGEVDATLYINPEHASGTRSEDSAVFGFSCPKGAGEVPVVNISDRPMENKENVGYGKVMGGKAGLYNGYVFRQPGVVGINFRPIGEAQESVIQNEDVKIQQGDSGGGVFRRNSSDQLELVGLLSTSDDINRRWPLGNYAANRSLDFVRCIKHRFSGKATESEEEKIADTKNPNSAQPIDTKPGNSGSASRDSKELTEIEKLIEESKLPLHVKETKSGEFQFCRVDAHGNELQCLPPKAGRENALRFVVSEINKQKIKNPPESKKPTPKPKAPQENSKVRSPVDPVPDKPGTAYSVNSLELLAEVVKRNRVAGIETKVMFSATWCGPCQRRKPDFLSEGRKASSNVRYYLFETNRREAIPSLFVQELNLQIGNISSFPTEVTY